MKTYVIKAPEGFEAVETVVDGVTNISFIPKVLEKKLPTTLENTVEFMPKICFCIGSYGMIEVDKNHVNVMCSNTLASKECAEAFLALMQLIRFRDIWNQDWVPDWQSDTDKFTIIYYSDAVDLTTSTYEQRPLYFKTRELRDEFYKEFKALIETAKPLL